MDLDAIRSKAQKVKAPRAGSDARTHASDSLDHLSERLRVADQRERRGLRKAAPLFAIAAGLLLLVLVVTIWLPPTLPPAGDVAFRVVLFSLFLLLAVEARRWSRRLAEIDYSAPTRQFLEATEWRYRFLRPRDYPLIVVGCLVVGAVTGIHIVSVLMDRYFGPEHLTVLTVGFGVFFVVICAMGLTFTYGNWKRDKRPLWLEIRQLLAELDANESS